jgi:hypothetical protein
MNDSANWRLNAIDPGGGSAEGDRWRMVNANNDLLTRLIADLQLRVSALEVEVAKQRPSESIGDDDAATN